MAEPLFRHEGGAELAAAAVIERWPAAWPSIDDVAGVRRSALAGQRGEQFVLAVAGDAGDAEDFAAFDLERDAA